MAERKAALYSTSARLYYRAVKNERVIPPEMNPNKPPEHVRLGDIVVSNREGVVQYDFGVAAARYER
jgi:hypothetical protein